MFMIASEKDFIFDSDQPLCDDGWSSYEESCMTTEHVMELDLPFAVTQQDWKEISCKTALWCMYLSS